MAIEATKRSFDVKLVQVDVGRALGPHSGLASLDSVDLLNPIDNAMTISEKSFAGTVVQFLCAGGTARKAYRVRLRVTTNGTPAQTIESVVDIQVTA